MLVRELERTTSLREFFVNCLRERVSESENCCLEFSRLAYEHESQNRLEYSKKSNVKVVDERQKLKITKCKATAGSTENNKNLVIRHIYHDPNIAVRKTIIAVF